MMIRSCFSLLLGAIAFLAGGCTDQLVFVRDDGGVRKIFRMDSDGGAQQRISPAGATTHMYPDVSPDGQKIAYTDGIRVFISNLGDIGGSSQVQLSTGTGTKTWLRWSPDQQVIAYTQFISGTQAGIWLAATSGVNSLQVTFPTGSQSDGGGHDFYLGPGSVQNLVYSRSGTLYTMFYNGTQPATPITSSGTATNTHTLPVVSHDNKLLAYRLAYMLASVGTIDAIQVVEVGTWAPRFAVILPSPQVRQGSISAIAFSCDDQRLYVTVETAAGAGDRHEVYSVKLDGGDLRQLTSNAVFDSQPSAISQPCS